MPYFVQKGPTILAGESLSDVIDCTQRRIVRVGIPVDWTPAVLTFLASSDGEDFSDLLNANGDSVVAQAIPHTQIAILTDWGFQYGYFKFRSGTASRPVPQESNQAFSVALIS